jgi:hypothetical protein
MIDVDAQLRDEVNRLLPTPVGFAADWGEVAARAGSPRRRRHYRPALLSAAALAAAVCACAALGATVWLLRGPDQIRTVASGPGWSLVAHRDRGRLCVSYGSAGTTASSCRLNPPHVLSLFALTPTSNGRSRVIGLASPQVKRVQVSDPAHHRVVRARIYALPAFFHSPLRFFVAEVVGQSILRPGGARQTPALTLSAYGLGNRVLRRISLQ